MTPETCPNCGEEVPRGARACPGCGADERTGWSDRADADRLGIQDPDDFDHETFVKNEFGQSTRGFRPAWWWWVAIGVLVALVWSWF